MEQENLSVQQLLQEIEDLKRQLSDANAANVAKETFLSNMSHDIRTPMNAIVGMTSLAKKHIDEKHRVQDALNKIETASQHLLSLINDVLDMSRINSGRMNLSAERFSLPDLLHDVLAIMRPQFEQRGHSWHLDLENIDEESFYGDELRIRQVLVNILGNAAKYTPDGGNIEIKVSERAGADGLCILSFVCKDNGVGMSPQFLERIFEPFERVNNSTISGIEGTGLGMSIVKKIVDAMGGTINIQSRQGEGTAVTIGLPLKPVEESADSAVLDGKRVLVIEADEELCEKYKGIFVEFSIDFTIVPSVVEAIAAITDAGFTGKEYNIVIIGEKRANQESVLEASAYLSKSHPGLVLVIVSSADWEEIEYRAQRSGVQGFIPVPFFKRSLINGLSAALEKGGQSREASAYPDLSGRVILLAEDNLINREIAKEMLSATGAVIEAAEDGKQALDMFCASAEGYYSLVLMDIQMPVMDGYAATRAIRTSGRPDSGLPIFAMTANTFAEDIAKARDAGMDGHIAKPVDMNALMQTLRRAMQG